MFVVRGRNSCGTFVITTPPGRVNTVGATLSTGAAFVRREPSGRIGVPRGPGLEDGPMPGGAAIARRDPPNSREHNTLPGSQLRNVRFTDILSELMRDQVFRNFRSIRFECWD